MSNSRPIKVYGHDSGPNPWKVVMILEELELPYEIEYVEMKDIKSEPYISVNPNGRVPAIIDPNTNITLWESNAIIEYLIETYDKENKLTFTTFPEKFHLRQWSYFQSSGQGPYFGQLSYFRYFFHEDLPSVKTRYEEQMVRVLSVLDRALVGKEYLVGDKCTYADIAFVSWNLIAHGLLADDWNTKHEIDTKYPNFVAWHTRVASRPAVKKALEVKQQKMQGGH